MVIYDLVCDFDHAFEGWFKDSHDYVSQQASGLVTCPFCDSEYVSKKLAVPNVGRKSNSAPAPQELVAGEGQTDAYLQLQDMLNEVHDFIEENFEDVGNRFAEEAMSIHRGEREGQNIRGTATLDQLQKLSDEGVAATPLPKKPYDKKKLN